MAKSTVHTPDMDVINQKVAQLNSLLTCMYGVGADMFEKVGKGHREILVWLAADLAGDIMSELDGEVANG